MTIFLTTHYIQEAEEMADRIGVMNKGELIVVENKDALMRKLGKKQVTLELAAPLAAVPPGLADLNLELAAGGRELIYRYDVHAGVGVAPFLRRLEEAGVGFSDLRTEQTSLEEIFVSLVRQPPPAA